MGIVSLSKGKDTLRPDGRLVPVFAASEDLPVAELILALARTAARRGESVLVLDQAGGAFMHSAGIIAGVSLSDVLKARASIRDAKYICPQDNFAAINVGPAKLETLLGSLAALSLNYDWVFVATEPGCTPGHTALGGAADTSLILYDTYSDRFMRAYWMMDALRARAPEIDPLVLPCGPEQEGFETFEMLQSTITDFLGAPPALGGILENRTGLEPIAPAILEALRYETRDAKRRA